MKTNSLESELNVIFEKIKKCALKYNSTLARQRKINQNLREHLWKIVVESTYLLQKELARHYITAQWKFIGVRDNLKQNIKKWIKF